MEINSLEVLSCSVSAAVPPHLLGRQAGLYYVLYLGSNFDFILCFPTCIFIVKVGEAFKIENFDFVQVGEALPLNDASVDAVVGTLVLCSVKDVDLALKGI